MANEAFLMSLHRDLLADGDTQGRFRKAIRAAVREGDRVLDLGAGTGVHAVFACEAGASRVYAVENDRIIDLAREIVARNGYEDRVTFVEGKSTEVELPELVDVLVANLGFDASLRYLPDARDRFLAEGGRGMRAIAHNGNLTNVGAIRAELEGQGAIFQSAMDTEVIVHLMARARGTLEERLVDALSRVRGAYSLVLLADDVLVAARDPYGFRPLSLGRLDSAWVVASETCAFDLVGARSAQRPSCPGRR